MEDGDDGIFSSFGIHESECVMVLEHEDGDVKPPDVEHGGVDYVSE